MRHVDVVLPELLVQRLRERANPVLARREQRRLGFAAQRRRRAREDQHAPAALRVDFVGLECSNGELREGEGRGEVDAEGVLDLSCREAQEGLDDARARVEDCDAQCRRGERAFDGDKGLLDVHGLVRGDRERRDFDGCTGLGLRADIGGQLFKMLGVAGDECDVIALFREYFAV